MVRTVVIVALVEAVVEVVEVELEAVEVVEETCDVLLVTEVVAEVVEEVEVDKVVEVVVVVVGRAPVVLATSSVEVWVAGETEVEEAADDVEVALEDDLAEDAVEVVTGAVVVVFRWREDA